MSTWTQTDDTAKAGRVVGLPPSLQDLTVQNQLFFERRIHLFVKMRLCETCALLGVLFLTIFEASDCLQTVVRPNKGSEVTVSTALPLDQCAVCRVSGVNDTETSCSSSITLTPEEDTKLLFNCSQPVEQSYTVTITHAVECTKDACSITAAEAQPSLLTEFARTFTWQLKAPEKTVVSLNILGQGLMETSQPCTNGLQYLVVTTETSGEVRTQYCQDGGSVTLLDLPNQAAVSVQVKPKGQEVGYRCYFQHDCGVYRDAQGPECEVCTVDGSTTPNCNPTEQTLSSAEKHSLEFSCPKPQEMYNVKMTMKIATRMMSVTPDPNTIIIITRVAEEPDCSVCMDDAPKQICNPRYLRITDPRNTSVEFTCPRPQDIFSVEINREIDCTETSCSGDIVQAESLLFPDFNRTFTWDLKVVSNRAFQLDFPEPGMRQIPNEETCPDEHTYSLVTYLRTGPATIGTFCKGGTVTTVLARYKGRMSLLVPGDAKLNPVDFKLRVGPETEMVAIVKVNLPRGVSDTGFITASYPADFPDEQQMQWDFTVPGMHNYSMHFNDHTAPECLSGDVAVEYKKEKKVTKLTLTDPQPQHQQGNFNMVLKNCKTNRTLKGLTLNYKVSVMRSGHPVLCTVDLTKRQGVSVQIEKVGSDPYCEMSIDSKVEKKIKVAAGTKANLSFLDCPYEDMRLTASAVIDCKNVGSALRVSSPCPHWTPVYGCPSTTTPGTSTSLRTVQWTWCRPQGVSSSPSLKVQVHANVSVTATAQNFNKTRGPLLNVSFSEEIPETIIYRVNPRMSSPTLLATPNWPGGMRPSSTVSWVVAVPSYYQAQVEFVNFSQPKCLERHTAIIVKMLGHEEELMSRREDEEAEDLLVTKSFYLNMSNCIPEERHFGGVTKIVLQSRINISAIIAGTVGVLVFLLIVLAVEKEKERANTESSIYIGKGSFFRPGDRHFTKSRPENNSHVYDSIDEMMVYGHLLGDSSYGSSTQDHYPGIQVDSYKTFTGPTDGQLPVIKEPDPEPEMDQYKTFLDPSETFIPSRPRTPIDRQDSLGFQDRRMVDNELYTFKSTGDINTIRLSGADMELQPPTLEESL
ncbi:hypothetical protein INR49_027460 [Caranx melampygus]|nr:hypothetical protein INR49_027460 [Caranx melampygus]